MTKKKSQNPSGNSRAAQNRKIRQDALRQELASRNYVSQLQKIADRLDPEAKDAYQREDVPMVKERVGILFKMLDKTLPNLKPVELPLTFPVKQSLAEQAACRLIPQVAVLEIQRMTVKQRVSKLEKKVTHVAKAAKAPAGKTRIVKVPRGTRAEQEAFMANYPPFEVSDTELEDGPGAIHHVTYFVFDGPTDASYARD